MLLQLRLLVSGVLALLSAGLLYTSVHKLRHNPSGESLVASFSAAPSFFHVMAGAQCIGTLALEPQSEAIIMRASLESAEAGRVEASLGLVFNELSQLAQGTGRLRVKGALILEFDVLGVTPIELTIKSSAGLPLPKLPPIPLIISRKTVNDRLELYARGLGARDPARIDQLSLLTRLHGKLEVIAPAPEQPNCEFHAYPFSNLTR